MVLKRKRSASELCSSPSSSVSSFNSPPQSTHGRRTNPFATYDVTPIHLHSRTLKRFRDNRPSQDEVHQRTLNMLYSAQQQPQVPYEEESSPPVTEQSRLPQKSQNQQSLHRFWNIASAPTASTDESMANPGAHEDLSTAVSCCDDCSAQLGGSGDDQMDVDGFSAADHACGACGRRVCFGCSVSNLGEQRRCLQCAGRNAWAGDRRGWNQGGMSLF